MTQAAHNGPAGALERITQALRFQPNNARLLLQRAQHLLGLGRAAEAREAAVAAHQNAGSDPVLLDAIGTVLSRTNDQARALAAYEQAIALEPNAPHFIFNRAAVRRFLGDLEGAERDYDRVISLKPDDYEAWLNRSELRVQSAERNHIAELQAVLAGGLSDWRAQVALNYATAKEYEDLKDHGRSFEYLQRGARLRRAHLRYDVANDVATAEWIIQSYPDTTDAADPTERGAQHNGHAREQLSSAASTAAPIFIVGLPRSGSTLVERILGSHSQVMMGGELPQFALSVVAAVNRRTQNARLTRQDLIRQSALVDFARLGQDYIARVNAFGISSDRFTDKMPLNYLYCGLIRRALPNARVIHIRRSPMAACYAMYKTLFQDGYPFSYDLDDLGRYYLAYRRLMSHWSKTLRGWIHELTYEELVTDPLGRTRRLLEFCGLDWEDACAEFHANTAPSTTASAAQIRRRLYTTSIAQWRNYATQLEPLRQQLKEGGIDED